MQLNNIIACNKTIQLNNIIAIGKYSKELSIINPMHRNEMGGGGRELIINF